eukprot:jgi/Galph1/826/GphlegSOOS_G5557.1
MSSTPAFSYKDISGNTERPEHAVVLVHGLHGSSRDFSTLEKQLLQIDNSRTLIVFRPSINEGLTTDGISEGGDRLANSVRIFCHRFPSLTYISFVGFSLGGLYVRYALFFLHEKVSETDSRICGLIPRKLLLVASPNLGVSGFGIFRYIPRRLQTTITILLGKTISELFLVDKKHMDGHIPLLWAMTEESFLAPLKAFPKRYLLANVRNDLEVSYGTAAMFSEIRQAVRIPARSDTDENTIVISTPSVKIRKKWIDTFPTSSTYSDSGLSCLSNKYLSKQDVMILEKNMAQRLRSVGWCLYEVEFSFLFPPVHDAMVSVSRNVLFEWLFRKGRDVVQLLCNILTEEYINEGVSDVNSQKEGFKEQIPFAK